LTAQRQSLCHFATELYAAGEVDGRAEAGRGNSTVGHETSDGAR
jgi:hypothetical protein